MSATTLQNYAEGKWVAGSGALAELRSAIDGGVVALTSSQGLDFAAMVRFAREQGGPALRALTFHKRARMLKALAEALSARKENKPAGSAVEAAAAMGIELLTEQQYRRLQQLGEFDTKTSSWIATPEDVRRLGGALFCDRRYGKVFVYHNGVQSYYAARGFRGLLRV